MNKFLSFLAAVGMVLGMALTTFGAETEKPLIIDVRTKAEWKNGHLEGAVMIPYGLIGEKIGVVAKEKSKPIYVYCRSGRRSQIAKETLEKLGYQDIRNLGSLEDAAKAMKGRIVK